MPPNSSTPRINQWISLADFTPGIYQNTYIAGTTFQFPPAPLGSADGNYTYGCMGLVQGGLGPLPKLVATYSYATLPYATYTPIYVAQAFSTSSYGNLPVTDRFLIEFQAHNGTTLYWKCIDFLATTATAHVLFTGSGSTTTSEINVKYPFMTRIAKPTSTPAFTPVTTPGVPVVILSQTFVTASQVITYASCFPHLTTPSTYKVKHLSAVTQGYLLGFQGRVLSLKSQSYTWPGGVGYGTNENVNYTTPSNSVTLKTQKVVLDPTDPYGYGSWGSISAGELFLIKNRGGALLVTGDMNFPTVTKLPGVQSTGGVAGPGIETPAGLIYCSQGNGAWLWNGGNVSQKISQNLRDDFFISEPFTLNFFGNCWGEWVLFCNSWLYNLRTQSWWKLPIAGVGNRTLFWYYPARTLNQYFGFKQKVTTNTKHFGYKMTRKTPTDKWVWQSMPIKPAQNRYINIRELVLFVSNPSTITTTSTIQLQIYQGPFGTTLVFTYTTASGDIHVSPEYIRIPVGGVTLQEIVIRMTANGTHGAPIVHSLTIGITVRQHIETA